MQKSISTILASTLFMLSASSAIAAEPISEADLREGVAAYFRGADEPTVEAASWISEKEFAVGVHYMGNAEDSLARYVCSILGRRGLKAGSTVIVVDINTMGQDAKKWEIIGEADCRK